MFAKPHVAILCLEQYQLFSAVYGPHLHILATRLQISEATTLAQARRYLSSTVRPQAIIVADAFTTNPAYRDILFQLVDYAWAGGTVIYAGLVGCFTRPIDLDAAFQHVWGVPWRSSNFYQQTFSLNPSAKCISTDPKHVSHAYTMRARFVSKVELEDALYLEPLNVRRVELETGEQGQPTYETPAAFAPIGYGYLGFVGEVDGEEGTIKLLLAMCLLKAVSMHTRRSTFPRTVGGLTRKGLIGYVKHSTTQPNMIPLTPPRASPRRLCGRVRGGKTCGQHQ